jgi:hypothetical protein
MRLRGCYNAAGPRCGQIGTVTEGIFLCEAGIFQARWRLANSEMRRRVSCVLELLEQG